VRQPSRVGTASGVANLPMLLECDLDGNVIWASERTRMKIGAAATLAEILETRPSHAQSGFRLFSLLRAPEGLLLGAEDSNTPGVADQVVALRQLEQNLLLGYFRLQTLEKKLSSRAARRKHGAGRLAVRQIELERRRLGSELHTGVGQMLAAIRLQVEVVSSQFLHPPAPVRNALENIGALVAEALDQVRSVSRRLHPPEWQRLTIDAALRQLWDLSGIPLIFDATLDLPPLGRDPDLEVKTLIYRTAQEGLSNIIGHSKAKQVALSLLPHEDTLVLQLEDDGVGFDASALVRAPASIATGIGLRSITELAHGMGAKIAVESDSNGTKLVLSTPYSLEV
jgi:signal transduction histidine kinase